nr:hypothetical protein [Bryobacter sp.]
SRPDTGKIGMYGISWGGRTTLYGCAIDPRLAACVINGHFNDTVPKMLTRSPNYGTYLDSREEHAFFDNLANEFSDADIGALIVPRPVYVENGLRDRVAWTPMARQEWEKLRLIRWNSCAGG